MEAAKEEETVARNKKEKVGEKKALRQWKNHKVKKKKGEDHDLEMLFENFENEAKKLIKKTNEHAHRKGQDPMKLMSLNSSQVTKKDCT